MARYTVWALVGGHQVFRDDTEEPEAMRAYACRLWPRARVTVFDNYLHQRVWHREPGHEGRYVGGV
jgi:hypothetical protein